MDGERTGTIPVGNNRGRGQVSLWGLRAQGSGEEGGTGEGGTEGELAPGCQDEGKERQGEGN